MDKIQQLILDTYKEKPKHFSIVLRNNKDVLEYIESNVPKSIDTFLEQLYYAVYRKSNICIYGNKQPLKSFSGYSFCGKTGICQCARESVSLSVSQSKQSYTQEEKDKIKE